MPRPPLDRTPLPLQRVGHTYTGRFHSSEGSRLKVWLTINVDEDGLPREIFLTASKQGTVIRGLLDAVARLVSYMLQYGGTPQQVYEILGEMDFDPKGSTGDVDIPEALSVVDWVAQRVMMEGRGGS